MYTHQGYICKVLVVSQPAKSRTQICLEIIPLEAQLLWVLHSMRDIYWLVEDCNNAKHLLPKKLPRQLSLQKYAVMLFLILQKSDTSVLQDTFFTANWKVDSISILMQSVEGLFLWSGLIENDTIACFQFSTEMDRQIWRFYQKEPSFTNFIVLNPKIPFSAKFSFWN